jgi:hypothetical protein
MQDSNFKNMWAVDLVDVENNAQGGSIARVPFAALYDTLGL